MICHGFLLSICTFNIELRYCPDLLLISPNSIGFCFFQSSLSLRKMECLNFSTASPALLIFFEALQSCDLDLRINTQEKKDDDKNGENINEEKQQIDGIKWLVERLKKFWLVGIGEVGPVILDPDVLFAHCKFNISRIQNQEMSLYQMVYFFKFIICQTYYFNLVLLFRHQKIMNSFEFSPSHSLFFLWLHEQNQNLQFLTPLSVSQPHPVQLEKPVVSIPPTSGSQEQQPYDVPMDLPEQRNSRRASRYGGSSARGKGEQVDRDYHDPCFNPKKQKKNRNVLSNLVHHLLKYLSGKQMVLEKIDKIIRYQKMSISSSEFYLILESFEDKLSSYVTEKNFKTILMGSSELSAPENQKIKEFAKVFRILSYKFYKEECISSVIHSNKLSYESKKLHFQGLKDILQLVQTLNQVQNVSVPKSKKSK